MKSLTETIVDIIKLNELPSESDFLKDFLSGDNTRFDAEEGTYWDYKREFPFSLKDSDQFFIGIVRLVCALHNTFGGLIIFGVHDSERTFGHNKVKIDIERFNNRLRETLNKNVECSYRRYFLNEILIGDKFIEGESHKNRKSVDIILVPKRKAGSVSRLKVPFNGMDSKQVWIRRGPEVVEADSPDFSWLYGPRQDYGLDQTIPDARIEAVLPPSPATIRKFVGRSEVLDRLFHWLLNEDNEPRIFLHGAGGSGKSTIAYEFAKIVQTHGREMLLCDGNTFEKVFYFSAKERKLNTGTGKIVNDLLTDFSTKRELFEWIVKFNVNDNSNLQDVSDKGLLERIRNIFDNIRLLIVIDDIDTLINNGEAAGLDDLYKCAVKGKAGVKLLYTQRPFPSLSQENTIEVPGMFHDGKRKSEYYRFVEECCQQFQVPLPKYEFIDDALNKNSGRRPLVVETIIALHRSSGSYEEALRLYKDAAGDDTRAYLFEREYNRLGSDNRERHLLAALCSLRRPAAFDELRAILKFEPNQLKDAINGTRDIFLSLSIDNDETKFSLSDVAFDFVSRKVSSLDLYDAIKARVTSLAKHHHAEPPEVRTLRLKTDDAFIRGNAVAAWHLVESGELSHKVRQNPHFLALKGEVAAKQKPPRITEAREAFQDCVTFKHLALKYLRAWFWMEHQANQGAEFAEKVCNIVIQNERFAKEERAEFRARLGSVYFKRARENETLNSSDALFSYKIATEHHLNAYSDLFYSRADITKNAEFVRNTLFYFMNFTRHLDELHTVLDFVAEYHKAEKNSSARSAIMLDAAVDPLTECARRLPDFARTPIKSNRIRGSLKRFDQILQQQSNLFEFHDPDSKDRLLEEIAVAIKKLSIN